MNNKVFYGLVLFITVFNLLFRIYLADYHYYWYDEVREYTRSYEMVYGEEFQYYGPELNPPNNPIQINARLPTGWAYYLFSLPLFLSKDHHSLYYLLQIFNALALALAAILIKRLINPLAALITILFLAVSPFAHIAENLIWHPWFIPFFTMVFLLILYHLLYHPKSPYILLILPLMVLLVSFHLAAGGLFLVFIGFVIWQRIKIHYGWFILGGFIAVILCIPSIYAELDSGFFNLQQIASRGSNIYNSEGEKVYFAPEYFKIFQWMVFIFSSEISYYISRDADTILRSFYQYPHWDFFVWIFFDVLSLILVLWGFIHFLWIMFGYFRNKAVQSILGKPEGILLFCWLVFPAIYLALTRASVEPRYVFLYYPLGYIFISIAIIDTYHRIEKRKSRKFILYAGCFLLISLMVSQIGLVLKYFYFREDLGVICQIQEEIVDQIIEHSEEKNFYIDIDSYEPYPSNYNPFMAIAKYEKNCERAVEQSQAEIIYYPFIHGFLAHSLMPYYERLVIPEEIEMREVKIQTPLYTVY